MIPWAHPSPQPKRHLDRSSRFAGLTSATDRQTDRPTDHATRSLTIGRIYVRSTAMRPNNITKNILMGSDIFAGLMIVTDKHTTTYHAAPSITIGLISFRGFAASPIPYEGLWPCTQLGTVPQTSCAFCAGDDFWSTGGSTPMTGSDTL